LRVDARVMLLGRGDGHLAPGELLDTPFATERTAASPLADGRRGTAWGLASSEAEKERGFFYRRKMSGGTLARSTPMLFHTGHAQSGHGTPVTRNTGTRLAGVKAGMAKCHGAGLQRDVMALRR
jgi:hypothetical protein